MNNFAGQTEWQMMSQPPFQRQFHSILQYMYTMTRDKAGGYPCAAARVSDCRVGGRRLWTCKRSGCLSPLFNSKCPSSSVELLQNQKHTQGARVRRLHSLCCPMQTYLEVNATGSNDTYFQVNLPWLAL